MGLDPPNLQLTLFNPLEGLRDIRAPEAISWWPPAPGWWILGFIVMICLGMLALHLRRNWMSPARAAVRELARITGEFRATNDSDALAIALSIFLRRCVLAKFPQHDVAGLTGSAWLEFLNQTGATQAFTTGPGSVLISAPYRASTTIEADSLLAVVDAWVRHVLSPQRAPS